MSIALTVVKTKSAATHYETMIVSHSFTGSDVSELGYTVGNSSSQFFVPLKYGVTGK